MKHTTEFGYRSQQHCKFGIYIKAIHQCIVLLKILNSNLSLTLKNVLVSSLLPFSLALMTGSWKNN